jgi:hypothetical protein
MKPSDILSVSDLLGVQHCYNHFYNRAFSSSNVIITSFDLLLLRISMQRVHLFSLLYRIRIRERPITYIQLTYVLTNLLFQLSRVLLEKLIVSQLVKKLPAFYGTRTFITAFTSARHLSYPGINRSSPYPHIPLPEDPS